MDNSPTSLFESYEQDFKQLIASVRQKLDGEAKDQRGGANSFLFDPNVLWALQLIRMP